MTDSDVICTTCCGAGAEWFQKMNIGTVLIDEASQSIEPETLIAAMRASERLVLIGDYCQLRPFVLSSKTSALATSLFERLVKLDFKLNRLNIQYRMHSAISLFPSNEFYAGDMRNGVEDEQRKLKELAHFWLKPNFPLMWCQSKFCEKTSGCSYENHAEADAISTQIKSLLDKGIRPEQIGVITPYNGQKVLINDLLCLSFGQEVIAKLEICSVDGFQGREKDIIIISAVRLNVALTRAKCGLILVGNQSTLKIDPLWRKLINYVGEFYIKKFHFNTN